MPVHDSNRVEFSIDNGHIEIVTDAGQKVPAYWAHPRIGQKFSGICMLHDWWGMNDVCRTVANFFAQMGYYVIAPDMFSGELVNNPQQAMALLEKTQETRYHAVDATLSVLESHHRINHSVAAIGIGMGGTLAFEAAIKRDDLEAAVSYAGFPQQYFGQFARSNTPILAIYGSEEPYTKPKVIKALQAEFAQTPLKEEHQVAIIQGAGHDFFGNTMDAEMRDITKRTINHTLSFLEKYIEQPQHQHRPTGI
jgi:carboxymethylenebutenolidase